MIRKPDKSALDGENRGDGNADGAAVSRRVTLTV